MAAFGMLLVATLFLVHQAAGAARCSAPSTSASLVCDDSCNEVGRCPTSGVWQRTQNCQASGGVCRYVSSGAALTATCVTATSSEATSGYCNSLHAIDCPAVTTTTTFPSLIDCTSYYVCKPGDLRISPSQCGGRSFNSCTGGCTDSLTNGACPNTTTTYCTYVGQVGIAPGNDALHYRCDGSLQPAWEACGAGERFSLAAGACVNVGAVATCTVCAGAATVPSPLPHSGSVCSFLWCHARDNFELRRCLPGWYYVHSERGCVYDRGNTANC
ncbi:Protein of unknown function [Gryllus bimaculatus]|nr:Protein of unknown function [Gryllus bimaculatus]